MSIVSQPMPMPAHSPLLPRWPAPLLAFAFAAVFSLHAAEPDIDASQLPRVPPTPPERALETFSLKPGLRLELVAAEPLVIDPIAMSFDENGRLYVVEMRDYSERRPEQLGRIRLLEDIDGDGRFDKSTVFAADLPWPTAVACWDGGVFVGTTPDILYLKDTNRDQVADVRELVFSGFASDYAPYATNKLNVQAMMNSFQWTLDNRIHGASGGSGGRVRRLNSPFTRAWRERVGIAPATDALTPPVVDLRGRDFSFDPRTLEFRAESGGAQHGLSFDDFGRKFVCSNSDHLQQVLYEDRYISADTWFNLPPARVSIAADGPAAPVFRRSPDEHWRVIRTQWRVSGVVPGMIEGGGRPSGYFTGATGATIYRGDALGADYAGDAFIADCGSNLVHRKKLRSAPGRLALVGERPEQDQGVEFLASTDNWFRPVQFANAPDGALYIADMYREIIEHPWSLPESIKKHLDLNSGNDRGRIYRVVREGYRQRPRPQLNLLSSVELVALLQHPNGWHRDTAARLLYQRQDSLAVRDLERLAASGTTLARLHALHALDGLGELREQHVVQAMGAAQPELRTHGVRLSERFRASVPAAVSEALTSIANASAPGAPFLAVDFQLAWTLSRLPRLDADRIAGAFLARLYREGHPGVTQSTNGGGADAWFLPAVMNCLGSDPVLVLERTMKGGLLELPLRTLAPGQRAGRMPPPPRIGLASDQLEMVARFSRIIGTRRNDSEVKRTLALIESSAASAGPGTGSREMRMNRLALAELAEGLEAGGATLTRYVGGTSTSPVLRAAQRAALTGESAGERVVAIRALASVAAPSLRTNLITLTVAEAEPPEVRLAAVAALFRPAAGEAGGELLQRWDRLLPAQRVLALERLVAQRERIIVLLASIQSGHVRSGELTAAQQNALRHHGDESIRVQAKAALGDAANGSRAESLKKFLPALQLTGSAEAGKKIFSARCATCHRLGREGFALGPDLASVRANGDEKLLASIIDPNREVPPAFASYELELRNGESVSGVIASESEAAILLRQAGGKELDVFRKNIVSMRSSGQSLMPEGLEEGLSPQDMADLLEHVMKAR